MPVRILQDLEHGGLALASHKQKRPARLANSPPGGGIWRQVGSYLAMDRPASRLTSSVDGTDAQAQLAGDLRPGQSGSP